MTATVQAMTTLPIPDLSDVPVHMVCRTCWPHPVPEQLAVCGERPATMALDPVPDPFRPLCATCERFALEHHQCPGCGRVFR